MCSVHTTRRNTMGMGAGAPPPPCAAAHASARRRTRPPLPPPTARGARRDSSGASTGASPTARCTPLLPPFETDIVGACWCRGSVARCLGLVGGKQALRFSRALLFSSLAAPGAQRRSAARGARGADDSARRSRPRPRVQHDAMDGSAVRLQRLARRYARRGFTECEASGVGVGVRGEEQTLHRCVRGADTDTNMSSEHHDPHGQ